MSPAASRALGIAAIYQQPALFPHLTVAENIAFALEPRARWRQIDWGRRHRDARDLLTRVGADIDADRLVETLSMPEQQLVEIAKAIGSNARVLIMDEPTASLSEREVQRLFEVVARLKSERVGIIYISHRLEEILAIADRVTVLRDGSTVGTHARDGLHGVDADQPDDRPRAVGDFSQASGRAGIGGSRAPESDVRGGRRSRRVARGAERRDCRPCRPCRIGPHRVGADGVWPDAGRFRRRARARPAGRRAIAQPQPSTPASRTFPKIASSTASCRKWRWTKTSASRICRLSPGRGLIDRARERSQAERFVEQLRIKTASVASDVESLSGGNQQKVALARWLATSPKSSHPR